VVVEVIEKDEPEGKRGREEKGKEVDILPSREHRTTNQATHHHKAPMGVPLVAEASPYRRRS